ncbi:DUF4986 domain-containing protein [Streptomyces sp. NPDC048523]|uniref:DUF4986 domain-containing protein n=1 Tax=Streptomyces sp. NPDC048523 TaxID=3365567 RepID=UPI003724922C
MLAAEGDRGDLVGHFADDSRMGHVVGGPLRPLEHLPVVLARSTSELAAVVRRLAPDRPAFALEHVDARPGESVVLVPFAGIHESRYIPYFPVAEPERLYDRTVDAVAAGEQQPESDHRFERQDTWSELTGGARWRAATGLQVSLLPPAGAGPTRVLVDGQVMDTLTPEAEAEEVSRVLPLHADRSAGPVEVRFEAVGPAATIRLREKRLVR